MLSQRTGINLADALEAPPKQSGTCHVAIYCSSFMKSLLLWRKSNFILVQYILQIQFTIALVASRLKCESRATCPSTSQVIHEFCFLHLLLHIVFAALNYPSVLHAKMAAQRGCLIFYCLQPLQQQVSSLQAQEGLHATKAGHSPLSDCHTLRSLTEQRQAASSILARKGLDEHAPPLLSRMTRI